MNKLKIGDKVKVMLGKDKGKEGKIEKIYPKENLALVPDINMYKKHVKAVGDIKAGIYDIPRPMNVSKLMLVCPKCKKTTKVGFKTVKEDKLRICKKCGREVDTK